MDSPGGKGDTNKPLNESKITNCVLWYEVGDAVGMSKQVTLFWGWGTRDGGEMKGGVS